MVVCESVNGGLSVSVNGVLQNNYPDFSQEERLALAASRLFNDTNRVQKKYGVDDEKDERLDIDGVQKKYLSFKFDDLPVGYRFLPTDLELLIFLNNKVLFELIPPNPIQEIEATKFYSIPPNQLEWNPPVETKDMFFFIHHTDDSYNQTPALTQIVGDGIGCWKPNGDQENIPKSQHYYEIGNDDAALGSKLSYNYFRGKPPVGKELPKLKKTAWVMNEYRLPKQYYSHSSPMTEGRWVLGRVKCGKNTYMNV